MVDRFLSDADPVAIVREAERWWEKRLSIVRGIEGEMRRDPLAGSLRFLSHCQAQRRRLRRYLRSRFGYDAARGRWLRSARGAAPGWERGLWKKRLFEYSAWDDALKAATVGGLRTAAHGGTLDGVCAAVVTEALKHYRYLLVIADVAVTLMGLRSESQGGRAAAAVLADGWVAARLELTGQTGARLRRFLASESLGATDLRTELLGRLPGTAQLAWDLYVSGKAPRQDSTIVSLSEWLLLKEEPETLRAARAKGWAYAGEVADALASPELTPEQFALREEGHREARAALDGLTPAEREVIELYYLDGLKEREVAERLRKPLGTVKALKHKAIRKLRLQHVA